MRKLKNGVLKGFLDFTKETEIPEVFALWTGISTISATLSRDVFLDMGYFTVFPNTYVVLVAGSARCRKSTSIGVATDFMSNANDNIKILSQKTTPEAIISNLSGISAGDDNNIIASAEGILIVDELATLIDKNSFNSGLISVLTKLYDCGDFTYETKSRGVEHVKNPCLSLLGGSTIHWIKESIPKVAIGGGFTSRVIFVYKEFPDKLIPFPKISDEAKKIKENIIHDLNEITKMRGPFSLSPEAEKLYDEEYRKFMNESELFNDENMSGYAGRRHITMMKVAMINSASFKDERVIEYDDLKIAINSLEMIENDMTRVIQNVQSDFVGDVSDEVLTYIVRKKVVYRSDLVKKMTYRLTSQQLSVILETLLEYRNNDGNKIIEVVTEGPRTKYVYLG